MALLFVIQLSKCLSNMLPKGSNRVENQAEKCVNDQSLAICRKEEEGELGPDTAGLGNGLFKLAGSIEAVQALKTWLQSTIS